MSDSFEVRITPHGRVVRVKAGQSILDAALDAGLNLPHSCKSGHCSSCRARLVAGRIHYPHGKPLGLTAEEARSGDVLLEDGGRRSFSIANPPHDSGLIELHARHVAGGGFTERLFKDMQEGALLRIEGP